MRQGWLQVREVEMHPWDITKSPERNKSALKRSEPLGTLGGNYL